MGFVQQAGSDRKKIALHGIIFTLGVLASFGVLSGILFAARASTGWGYQLQNPWVVLTLMLLMFVLALNMFGVFEMGTSATSVGGSLQSKQGLAGSFFSGVLATVVATPCSGPFLGVAIGAAIALPALPVFLRLRRHGRRAWRCPIWFYRFSRSSSNSCRGRARGWRASSRRCRSCSSPPPATCSGSMPA